MGVASRLGCVPLSGGVRGLGRSSCRDGCASVHTSQFHLYLGPNYFRFDGVMSEVYTGPLSVLKRTYLCRLSSMC